MYRQYYSAQQATQQREISIQNMERAAAHDDLDTISQPFVIINQ